MIMNYYSRTLLDREYEYVRVSSIVILNRCKFNFVHFFNLIKENSKINHLEIPINTEEECDMIRMLIDMKQISILTLDIRCDIRPLIEVLCNCKSLRELTIFTSIQNQKILLSNIYTNIYIKYLYIGVTEDTIHSLDSIVELCDLIRKTRTIQKINFYNGLSNFSTILVEEALEENPFVILRMFHISKKIGELNARNYKLFKIYKKILISRIKYYYLKHISIKTLKDIL